MLAVKHRRASAYVRRPHTYEGAAVVALAVDVAVPRESPARRLQADLAFRLASDPGPQLTLSKRRRTFMVAWAATMGWVPFVPVAVLWFG